MEQELPVPPPPPNLQQFLQQNFAHSCSSDHYCFICNRAFCSHCCDGRHSVTHHPHQRPAAVRLRRIGQDWFLYAEDVKGTGYDWSRIQRVRHEGRKYILVNRKVNPPDHGMPLICSHCHDRMDSRAVFCSAACKVTHVHNGHNHLMVQTLVDTDFIERHAVDTFCTTCRRTFSQMLCPGHVAMHHADAEAHQLIRIARHEGWVLTPVENSLPEHVVNNVQMIVVAGVSMVPIFRREQPADGEAGGICLGCFQIVLGVALYCCLRCKADVLAN